MSVQDSSMDGQNTQDASGYALDGIYGFSNGVSDPGYDPSKVQNEINEVMQSIEKQMKGGKDPAFTIMYLMYLMQSYGGQIIGQDGVNQNRMNGYISTAKDLWTQVNSADNKSLSEDEKKKITMDYLTDLKRIKSEVNADPFFFRDHPEMKSTIDGICDSLSSQVGEKKNKYVTLSDLWDKANPDPSGKSQGDPSQMKTLDDSLGRLNSELTGGSSIMGSLAKAHTQNFKTEQDSFSNYLKMIQKIMQYLIQLQRTN